MVSSGHPGRSGLPKIRWFTWHCETRVHLSCSKLISPFQLLDDLGPDAALGCANTLLSEREFPDARTLLSQIKPDSMGTGFPVDHKAASQLVTCIYAKVPVDGEP